MVRLSNFVSWNPGIEGKQGQGQAVELRVLESWNRRENKLKVKLSNFVFLESWKGRNKGQDQAVKLFRILE
jgi:hypothetical protein